MRCFFKNCTLTVVTPGGQRFVNNIRMPIERVYPLEDGILIKAQFNADLISHEIGASILPLLKRPPSQNSNKLMAAFGGIGNQNRTDQHISQHQDLRMQEKSRTFVYLSVLEHPLNEAFPVQFDTNSLNQRNQGQISEFQHINTCLDLIHVQENLPFAIMYDQETRALNLCTIHKHKNDNSDNKSAKQDFQVHKENKGNVFANTDPNQNIEMSEESLNASGLFLKNLEQDSNLTSINMLNAIKFPQLFGPSQAVLKFQALIENQQPSSSNLPTNIWVNTGLLSSKEMCLSLYFSDRKEIQVYSTNIDDKMSPLNLNFQRKYTISNVICAEQIDYLQIKGSGCSQLVSSKVAKMLQETNNQNQAVEMNQNQDKSVGPQSSDIFQKRLASLTKDLLVFDSEKLQIFSGGYQLVKKIALIDLPAMCNIDSNFALDKISDCHQSNAQLYFRNNSQEQKQVRVSFNCQISDNLVVSILKVLKKVIPRQDLLKLLKDLIHRLSTEKCNLEKPSMTQFEVLSNILEVVVKQTTSSESGEQKRDQKSAKLEIISNFVRQQIINDRYTGLSSLEEGKGEKQEANYESPNKSSNIGKKYKVGDDSPTKRKKISVAQQNQQSPLPHQATNQTTSGVKTRAMTKLFLKKTQLKGASGGNQNTTTQSQHQSKVSLKNEQKKIDSGSNVKPLLPTMPQAFNILRASQYHQKGNPVSLFGSNSSSFCTKLMSTISTPQQDLQQVIEKLGEKNNLKLQSPQRIKQSSVSKNGSLSGSPQKFKLSAQKVGSPSKTTNLFKPSSPSKFTQQISPNKIILSSKIVKPVGANHLDSSESSKSRSPAYIKPIQVQYNSPNKKLIKIRSGSPMKTPSAIKFKTQVVRDLKFDKKVVEEIISILHLLLEDLKLNQITYKQESQKLRRLVVRLIIAFDDPRYANHLAYYLKESALFEKHCQIETEFVEKIQAYSNGVKSALQNKLVSFLPVPNIFESLTTLMGKQYSIKEHKEPKLVYPIIFEQTRKVFRLFEILQKRIVSKILSLKQNHQSWQQSQMINSSSEGHNSPFYRLLTPQNSYLYLNLAQKQILRRQNISKLAYFMLSQEFDQKSQLRVQENSNANRQRNNKEMQELFFSNLSSYEKILFVLRQEKIGIAEIQNLPSQFGLILLEIVRKARQNPQEIQTVPWPTTIYKLIHREDIINNLMTIGNNSKSQRQASGLDDQTPNSSGAVSKGNHSGNTSQRSKQDRQNNLLRQQSLNIYQNQLRRRKSKEFVLARAESNVFEQRIHSNTLHTNLSQVGAFEEAALAEEIGQNSMKEGQFYNQILQNLIGEETKEDQKETQDESLLGVQLKQQTVQITSQSISEFLLNKFGSDTRYKEVDNLLSSEKEMILKADHLLLGTQNQGELPQMSDQERTGQIQTQLKKIFRRHLSKCCGRGALILGIQETIPTETLQIPKISQSGFIPHLSSAQLQTLQAAEIGSNQVVLDLSKEEKEQLQWPSFHNGVTTALKISQCSFNRKRSGEKGGDSASSLSQTRNWIMYHKPQSARNDHAGFIMGLGLLGQLDSLRITDLYQLLKSTHNATTIGVLVGRAVSNMGKKSDSDIRTMCLHIPALLPPNLTVDISLSVQSAAVISAGLVYEGSADRLISEMLLLLIQSKPTSDKMIEREGFALAAGIALGFVNLGQGSIQQGANLEEETENAHLQQILNIKGYYEQGNQNQRELKLDERLIRFIEGGKTMPLHESMQNIGGGPGAPKSSAIMETDMVNVYVTSSAGLMALSFVHMKSNNGSVAEKLVIPSTFYELDFVRPTILLQKIVCKSLIMWDSIEESSEWIRSQIPDLIQFIYEHEYDQVEEKYATRVKLEDIDFASVALSYVNIIAGSCLSIGLRFAGTANLKAKKVIIEQIEWFRTHLRVVPGTQPCGGSIMTNTSPETKNQIDKGTFENCLCVLSLALSLVMAGTCDVETFRCLRVARKKIESEMHFGNNMALNMALGFLFLGSGAYSFGRSKKAIAGLFCAVYPIFPASPSDNRHHLQALRHFYILALETRLLQARDIDTGRYVNLEVKLQVRERADCHNQNQMQRDRANFGSLDGSKQSRISAQTPKSLIHNVSVQTPNIVNGQILSIEVRDHPEYHDVSLRVAMQINPSTDNQTAGSQSNVQTEKSVQIESNQSIFDQSSLQQVIYVKRKTYKNKARNDQKASLNIQELLLQQNVSFQQLIDRSKEATKRLIQVKDRSILTFLNQFVFNKQTLMNLNNLNIDKWSEISQKSTMKNRQILKNHLKMLIFLEDAYVADKVIVIPKLIELLFERNQTKQNLNRSFQKEFVSYFNFIEDEKSKRYNDCIYHDDLKSKNDKYQQMLPYMVDPTADIPNNDQISSKFIQSDGLSCLESLGDQIESVDLYEFQRILRLTKLCLDVKNQKGQCADIQQEDQDLRTQIPQVRAIITKIIGKDLSDQSIGEIIQKVKNFN